MANPEQITGETERGDAPLCCKMPNWQVDMVDNDLVQAMFQFGVGKAGKLVL